MRSGLACLAVLTLLALTPVAQGQEELIIESSAGSQFGIGGRAAGMGEAVLAMVNDGTAIVYNPAALVRIKRPEFYTAFSYERLRNETEGISSTARALSSNDLNKTRLGSINLTVPVPTYRGALVLAFGVNRTHSFDNTFTYALVTSQTNEHAVEKISGSIREWAAAGAMELSPRLAVGTTLFYLHGGEDYQWSLRRQHETTGTQIENIDNIDSRHSGFGARFGLRFELSRSLVAAMRLDSPIKFNIEQDWVQTSNESGFPEITVGFYEYDLTHPLKIGAGLAFRSRNVVIEANASWVDWSELRYDTDIDPELVIVNDSLSRAYDDVFSFAVGAEYIIPQFGLVLRGGFKHDPLPFSNVFSSRQIEKDRNAFSFGFSYLIDRVAMLDVGYSRATYKLLDADINLVQKYSSDRVVVSVAYRM